MNQWYCLNLGDAQLADAQLDQLKARFDAQWRSAGAPQEMALFIRHEAEGRLHCEVKTYFSPAAAALAQAVGALPCRQPGVESLGLLAGSDGCWAQLFSRHDG